MSLRLRRQYEGNILAGWSAKIYPFIFEISQTMYTSYLYTTENPVNDKCENLKQSIIKVV